jgi:hypothetical protein
MLLVCGVISLGMLNVFRNDSPQAVGRFPWHSQVDRLAYRIGTSQAGSGDAPAGRTSNRSGSLGRRANGQQRPNGQGRYRSGQST